MNGCPVSKIDRSVAEVLCLEENLVSRVTCASLIVMYSLASLRKFRNRREKTSIASNGCMFHYRLLSLLCGGFHTYACIFEGRLSLISGWTPVKRLKIEFDWTKIFMMYLCWLIMFFSLGIRLLKQFAQICLYCIKYRAISSQTKRQQRCRLQKYA